MRLTHHVSFLKKINPPHDLSTVASFQALLLQALSLLLLCTCTVSICSLILPIFGITYFLALFIPWYYLLLDVTYFLTLPTPWYYLFFDITHFFVKMKVHKKIKVTCNCVLAV